jgi:hypothetical protein
MNLIAAHRFVWAVFAAVILIGAVMLCGGL